MRYYHEGVLMCFQIQFLTNVRSCVRRAFWRWGATPPYAQIVGQDFAVELLDIEPADLESWQEVEQAKQCRTFDPPVLAVVTADFKAAGRDEYLSVSEDRVAVSVAVPCGSPQKT